MTDPGPDGSGVGAAGRVGDPQMPPATEPRTETRRAFRITAMPLLMRLRRPGRQSASPSRRTFKAPARRSGTDSAPALGSRILIVGAARRRRRSYGPNEYPYYRYIGDRPSATVAASFVANLESMPITGCLVAGEESYSIRPGSRCRLSPA